MQIFLNGETKTIPGGLTVKALLEHLDITPERVAVEINEGIVRKAVYDQIAVRDGDRVEVVQFMGGGASTTNRPRHRDGAKDAGKATAGHEFHECGE